MVGDKERQLDPYRKEAKIVELIVDNVPGIEVMQTSVVRDEQKKLADGVHPIMAEVLSEFGVDPETFIEDTSEYIIMMALKVDPETPLAKVPDSPDPDKRTPVEID